jgi:pimeloyl-ACP methyl ester carboxylesterase
MNGVIRSVLLVSALALSAGHGAAAYAAPQTNEGVLSDGTPWRIDVPEKWNGVALVDLDYAGQQNPAATPRIKLLLDHGYALAGASRAKTGWRVKESADNLAQVAAEVQRLHGKPKLTIAFGQSLGGHTSFGAVELRPDVFDGGVSMCGAPAGVIGLWNGKTDAMFVAKTLLAPQSNIPLIHYPADQAQTVLPEWKKMFEAAQATPAGRARIALAATLAQLPTWSDTKKTQPAATDDDGLQAGLYDSLAGGPLPLVAQYGSSRYQLEQISGGNFTFNTGVGYAAGLKRLSGARLVERLYKKAGLNLQADLQALAKAPRIAPEPAPISVLSYQIYGAHLQKPIITMHASGDPISPIDATEALTSELRSAGKADLVRQVYTNAAGHCPFSPAETLAVTERLVARLNGGRWQATDAATMNKLAQSYAAGETRFIVYKPNPFLRPFGQKDLAAIRKARAAKSTN